MPGPGDPVLEELTEVWASVVAACEQVDDEQWSRPTDCPGWSVKDHLSHLIGIERMLLGDPSPSALAEVPDYVLNPVGEINEAWVASRRDVPGSEVLAEFVDTTNRRIDALSAMTDEEFDRVGWSPVGEVPYREFMATRVLDTWAHEQDIRTALGRPGGRNGAGEQVVLDGCGEALPYVVGKKVAPGDGTSVLVSVTGVLGRHALVVVDHGRAALAPLPPAATPTVSLTLDQESFWRRCYGRVGSTELLAGGSVAIDGDVELGRRVVEAMAFMM
jgi:uncharacterized protein (TIGR03083 family)